MNYQPPGQLRSSVQADWIMMICTAGHVDHGKTCLVKLLTGCNTDRLKAEQERGLTIELGFAPCFLGGNLSMGIVDVPGHEKFIKNMVAGVSGIDSTILVIAADDGVMPQTIEHLQIMDLLGIRSGIVALTKVDLVDPDHLRLVTEQVRDFLKGTFLENAAICPVSSQTLEGYAEFYNTLVDHVKGLLKRRRSGIFRMPVERSFSQKGFGSVIQGIPVEGLIRVGDQVEVVPGLQRGRVRAIQVFGREASLGGGGQCLALNIPDFGKNPPGRGQVICLPGYLKPARFFHVSLRAVSGIQTPLRNGEQIKFHTGTLEEPGKIYLLENERLPEGRESLATLALPHPVHSAVHDRFIIRRPSPAATVAGGVILAVFYGEQRPRKKKVLEMLRGWQEFFKGFDPTGPEGIDRKIEYFLCVEQVSGGSLMDISRGTMLHPDVVKDSLSRMMEGKRVLSLGSDYIVHWEGYRTCLEQVARRIEKAGSEERVLSLSLSDLRKGFNWPLPLWTRIQEDLEAKGLIRVRENKFVLKTSVEKLDDEDRELMDRVLGIFEETGYVSPRPEELPERLNVPEDRIERLLNLLCSEGKLVRLSKNVILSYTHLKRAQDLVVKIIQEKGSLNSAFFKYDIGSTRKYALAILDYFDSRRVTVRIQNDRKLAPYYERNLL